MVDTMVLEAIVERRGSSSLPWGTKNIKQFNMRNLLFVPLDTEIISTNFELGEKVPQNQYYWDTSRVVNHGGNYSQYRWLLDQFSLSKITVFTHKYQTKPVESHLDVYGNRIIAEENQQLIENEPAGFHVVLKGNVDSLEIFDGVEWVIPILPKVPCAYLLNLTSCWHRVKEDHMRETLYIRGIIDKEKHEALIKKNLEKYANLAVYQK